MNTKGLIMSPYTDAFIKRRRTAMSLLKDLGFGRSFVQTRINVELETLVESICKFNGRPFDPNDLVYRFNNGVIMGFMFGRHVDYDDEQLMQEIDVLLNSMIAAFSPKVNLLPILRFLPSNMRLINKVVNAHRCAYLKFTILSLYRVSTVRN